MAGHPAVVHVLKFFSYSHLPEKLQDVSRPFAYLAQQVAERAPDSPETTVALRKLLEAKDAAVRAVLSLLLMLFAVSCASASLNEHRRELKLPYDKQIVVLDASTRIYLDGRRCSWQRVVRRRPLPTVARVLLQHDCVTLRAVWFRSRR
jgi:N-glycosylase/DNA lyase